VQTVLLSAIPSAPPLPPSDNRNHRQSALLPECRYPQSRSRSDDLISIARQLTSNMAEVDETIRSVLRGVMSSMRIPSASDKVYKDECVYSFDSPFSDGGLYVNLVSLRGFGKDYLQQDILKGGKAYLLQKWTQVEKKSEVDGAMEPTTKLAIGVSGGFMSEEKWDIVKEHWLVVVTPSGELRTLPLSPELPEFVSSVIQGVIDHDGMRTNLGVSSWDADNEKFVSKYASDLLQLNPSNRRIPQDPTCWKDEATGATDNLWLNLSTGYIGGGM
jgi:ubiquitin carboxyl-terminal hydrolase 5/13